MSSQWDPEEPEEDNGSSAEEEYLQSISEVTEETVPEVEEGQTNNNNNKQNMEGSIMSDNLSIHQSQTGDNEIPNNSSVEKSVNTTGVPTPVSSEEVATPHFNSSNNRTIGNLKNGKRQINKKIARMENEIADYVKILDRGYFIKKNKEGRIIQEKLDGAGRIDIQAQVSDLRLLLAKSRVEVDKLSTRIKVLSSMKKESNNSKLKRFKIDQKISLQSSKIRKFVLSGSQNGSKAVIGDIQHDIKSGSEESATQKIKLFIKEKIDLSKKGIKVSSPEEKKVVENIFGYIKTLQLN